MASLMIQEALKPLLEKGIRLEANFGKLKIDLNGAQLSDEDTSFLSARKKDIIEYLNGKSLIKVSYAQERLFFLWELGYSHLFHVVNLFEVNGKLDVVALNKAINYIISRHETLRTGFALLDGSVVQVISPEEYIFIEQAIPLDSNHQRQLVSDFIERPFSHDSNSLFRVLLLKTGSDQYQLGFCLHHIISDGWSVGVFLRELQLLYAAFMNEEQPQVPALPVQYAGYSAWHRRWFNEGKIASELSFWKERLAGYTNLKFPADYKMPPKPSGEGGRLLFNVTPEVLYDVKKFCGAERVTLYAYFSAVVFVLLRRFTLQRDICLGMSVANRNQPELENLIGFFVNILPLRISIADEAITVQQILRMVYNIVIEAQDHQNLPFEKIVEEVNSGGDLSQNPVVQAVVNYVTTTDGAFRLGTTTAHRLKYDYNIAKFDLTFDLFDSETGGLDLNIEYRKDLFRQETIQKRGEVFVTLFSTMFHNPDADIDLLELTTEKDLELIRQWNNTYASYPSDATLAGIFEEVANRHPERIAVDFQGERLTYNTLNKKANRIGNTLREMGVSQGVVVAVMMEKGLNLPVAILAILKAGGIYLPLDNSYPSERKKLMLEDSDAKVVLVDNESIPADQSGRYLNLDDSASYNANKDNLPAVNQGNDVAYIVYTSGTTGKPKGVMVTHRNVLRLVLNTDYVSLNENVRLLQTGSVSFDAFTFEYWAILLHGGELHLASTRDLLEVSFLKEKIRSANIDMIWMTSSWFNQVAEQDPLLFKPLTYLLVGGEALSPYHINKVKAACPNLNIINGYGPTENTTFSLCHIINDNYEQNIPIGKPIANSTAYIVDKAGKLLPPGLPGELWVGGDGVSLGYLNSVALTTEKFVNNPFGSGRLYRTGDAARWLHSGLVEFIGRIDNQVKINGYRIELEEIEQTILSLPVVSAAVVAVNTDADTGEKFLIAYYVASGECSADTLKSSLKKKLPKYMLPAFFIQLETIPLTLNGKVDKKALPAARALLTGAANDQDKAIPANEAEQTILEEWKKVLKRQQIGVTDNFFEIGGTSVKAINLVAQLQKHYQVKVADIFTNPTVRELAHQVAPEEHVLSSAPIETAKAPILAPAGTEVAPETKILIRERKEKYQQQIAKCPLPDPRYKTQYKNILLLGSTGYLGIHLLKELLTCSGANLYLIIRAEDDEHALKRLNHKLDYYFNDRISESNTRIILLNGDISKTRFGLETMVWDALSKSIDCIINAAANVKHYGKKEDFLSANVLPVKHIIDFSETNRQKHIHQVSTLSVAGNPPVPKEARMPFTEFDLDIGQVIENYYVKSKYQAEALLLNARQRGVYCNIYRVGNLTFQSETGIFQENMEDNAFYNQIKAYLTLGFIPEDILFFELSPVDLVAKGLLHLFDKSELLNQTYHIFNNNLLSVESFCSYIQKDYPIEILKKEKFTEKLYSQNDLNQNEVNQLLLHLGLLGNSDNSGFYEILCDKTILQLHQTGFEWEEITRTQIDKMIRHGMEARYFPARVYG